LIAGPKEKVSAVRRFGYSPLCHPGHPDCL